MKKRQESAKDIHAAHWVLWRLLPPLLLDNATFNNWKPHLEDEYQRLLHQPAYIIPGNLWGIEHAGDVYDDQLASRMEPQRREAVRETQTKARAYVSKVKDLAARLRLAESYGPALIHSLVDSAVTMPGLPYRPPATLTRPTRLSLQVEINPMARYYPDLSDLPNPLAPYYPRGEPLPIVSWQKQEADFSATAIVRDLPDLQKLFNALIRRLERDAGLRRRKPRSEAYQHLQRNTQWFYLNRCEGKSAEQIADALSREAEEGGPDTPDVAAIQKGIAQIEELLSSIRVS